MSALLLEHNFPATVAQAAEVTTIRPVEELLAGCFLRLAAEGETRQRLLESGLDPRAVRRAVRYGRAQELEQAR